MPITYTNRKGRTYYLCLGTTKIGKPCYYFATEPKGLPVEELPAGYHIQESVNGVVSLSKIQPDLLLEEEVNTVKMAIQTHPQAQKYRLDVKSKTILIYEHVGPDIVELGSQLVADFGQVLTRDILQRLQEQENRYGQFTAILRFTLTDATKRHFKAERMCFLGSIDDRIDIAYDKPISELAAEWIPKLGSKAFFELF